MNLEILLGSLVHSFIHCWFTQHIHWASTYVQEIVIGLRMISEQNQRGLGPPENILSGDDGK